jgi:hypothetical protein
LAAFPHKFCKDVLSGRSCELQSVEIIIIREDVGAVGFADATRSTYNLQVGIGILTFNR